MILPSLFFLSKCESMRQRCLSSTTYSSNVSIPSLSEQEITQSSVPYVKSWPGPSPVNTTHIWNKWEILREDPYNLARTCAYSWNLTIAGIRGRDSKAEGFWLLSSSSLPLSEREKRMQSAGEIVRNYSLLMWAKQDRDSIHSSQNILEQLWSWYPWLAFSMRSYLNSFSCAGLVQHPDVDHPMCTNRCQ
jgi:hypothetical protein